MTSEAAVKTTYWHQRRGTITKEVFSNLREFYLFVLTLHYDISSRVDSVDIIGCETGVFSSVSLRHVLDIQPARGGDVDASVTGQGAAVAFSPGHSGLRLACGAALQGHALSHQHLCILRLDHKTRPCWRSGGGAGRGRAGDGTGRGKGR